LYLVTEAPKWSAVRPRVTMVTVWPRRSKACTQAALMKPVLSKRGEGSGE
jgi:hypothetical protein